MSIANSMRGAVIFVSYRRDDSGPFALALRAELDLRLDGAPLFMDLSRIQGGDAWPEVLEDALRKANILIAVIGDNWAGTTGGASRLDDPGDWVRKEVARALNHPSAAVIPVLLNGARMPDPSALPEEMRGILSLQAVPLRTSSWDSDLRVLSEVLRSKFGVRTKRSDQFLPEPADFKRLIDPLSDQKLNQFREEGKLPGWSIETVHDVQGTGAVREFLKKKYLFRKDRDAFKFIEKISALTRKHGHHPIIEAKYADVAIRLSTWDAGHYVTMFDTKMAIDLDKLAQRWPQRPAA